MPSSAGQQLTAGRIPYERIATTEITTNSSAFTTTETVVATVVAPLVSGRTYRVKFTGAFETDTGGERVVVRIREDNVNGTGRQTNNLITSAPSALGWPVVLEGRINAQTTENKTIVATAVRVSGSGDINLVATGGTPSFLYVDYIEDT